MVKELRSRRVSGHCIIDEIFIVRQIYENHLTANEPLYMAFLGMQRADVN